MKAWRGLGARTGVVLLGVIVPFTSYADGPDPTHAYGDWPELCGPYLGQTPPGAAVQEFAPGIVQPPKRFHSSILFSADGTEAYWTEQGGRTWCSRRVDRVWQRPFVLPFDDEYGVREPFFGEDGKVLYFLSRRPPDDDPVDRERIWWVRREEVGWSRPQIIDPKVRAHPTHWQFSLDARGDLYFTSELRSEGGEGDIFVAVRTKEGFADPHGVGTSVNSDAREFCPFIAPDDSYLLFARSAPGRRSDLYVSFRNEDGSWANALPLSSDVNSAHNEVSPLITPDGKYLFFLRMSAGYAEVCWVDASVISEALR